MWALAVSYWLHMLATVAWVGGLALMAVLLGPTGRAALGSGPAGAAFLDRLERRFSALAWASLAVLAATGLTQMAANKHYTGLLQISHPWAAAILAKHLVIGLMAAIAVYQQGSLQPQLARAAALEAHGRPVPEAAGLRRRQLALIRLTLLCGLVVLGLTAVARSL
jgi:uncharacterized membrane protein